MRSLLWGAIAAIAISGLATPWFVRLLARNRIAQPIQDELMGSHGQKWGTPTMGGAIVIAAAVVGWLAGHVLTGLPFTRPATAAMAAVVGACVVGFLDDWIKVRNERNLGLREREKTIGMLLVGLIWAVVQSGAPHACTSVSATRCGAIPIKLGPVLWIVLAVALIWLTSNSVNFTDGIEGLLAGSSTLTFLALTAMGFWAFRHPEIYRVDGALDLALVAACMGAGTLGFLWWNSSPKVVFMGDVGSMPIGTTVAVLALAINVWLLLPVLGVLYVAEGASSWLQRVWFRRTGGKRLFRMAPVHHHFDLGGWSEAQIVVRFWIANFLGAALTLAIFYADFLHLTDRG